VLIVPHDGLTKLTLYPNSCSDELAAAEEDCSWLDDETALDELTAADDDCAALEELTASEDDLTSLDETVVETSLEEDCCSLLDASTEEDVPIDT
jgi:hypothetical protein